MFYIIEHDIRPDGTVNTSEVGRSTEAMARSFYYERYSKMIVTDQFKSVALMLVDENLTIYEHNVIATQYVEPEPVIEEPEPIEDVVTDPEDDFVEEPIEG